MNSDTWGQRSLRAALFAFVIAPISGFLIGLLLGLLGEIVTGEGILLGFAVPMGTVAGLVFGSIVAIPFSGLTYPTILKYLGTGTIAPSLILIFCGAAGPALAWIGGIVGFWIAAALLTIDLFRGRLEDRRYLKSLLEASGEPSWVETSVSHGDTRK